MTREEVMAMEAGPDLDALIAEKIMGLRRRDTPAGPQWCDKDGPTRRGVTFKSEGPHGEILWHGWRPSADIAAAWEVVDAMRACQRNLVLNDGTYHPPTYEVQAGLDEHGPWTFCCFSMEGGINARAARAMSAPLAICRAALLTTLDEDEYAEGRRFMDGSYVKDGRWIAGPKSPVDKR